MSRGQFNTVWLLAIILCAFFAVFTTFFVSCTKAPKGQDTIPSKPTPTQQVIVPDDNSAAGMTMPSDIPVETPADNVPPETDGTPQDTDEALPDSEEDIPDDDPESAGD